MSWNHTPISSYSYSNIQEFYDDDLKYSWGNKYTILDHKIVGKKKGKLYELIRNNETKEVFANLTLVEVGAEEASYKTIGLDDSIPAAFAKQMSPVYKEKYDELKNDLKEYRKQEKLRKEVLKNLKLGDILKMKTGHIVKFNRKVSSRTFAGNLNEHEDQKEYGWKYIDVVSVI